MEAGTSDQIFPKSFKDAVLERLFQTYSVKQKRSAIECYLLASVLFNLQNLVLIVDVNSVHFVHSLVFLTVNIFIFLWCRFSSKPFWSVIPHVTWGLSLLQVLVHMGLQVYPHTSRDYLGWILLISFFIYATLPVELQMCRLLSIVSCIVYILVILLIHHLTDSSTSSQPFLFRQICTNVILLVSANILGQMCFTMSEKEQRTAFLETRQCLEMRLVIEEQSAEQERLLLSVLPEHVAVKMRQDLGESFDSQFKKIYMSRHENVSILYADIVGFTAISSTYSASELVKILNELFARFDRLSEKYNQLRIKILGDCYYCISGAPEERPDHAILSVHMGLSMVKAIKYVQQTTNSPVDMRVGIHTGAVLAGVLGQRQWQFDVYSKDVELANKMESSGLPGRVHISEKTLCYIDGNFEVEPAFGENREETLRQAGLKTYFIVNTIIPFKDESGGRYDVENYQDFKDDEIVAENNIEKTRAREDSEDFKMRLKKDVMERDLSKYTGIFSKRKLSINCKGYNQHKDSVSNSKMALASGPIILFFITIAKMFVLPWNPRALITIILNVLIFIVVLAVAIVPSLPQSLTGALEGRILGLNDSLILRQCMGAFVSLLIFLVNIIYMLLCEDSSSLIPISSNITSPIPHNCSLSEISSTPLCVFPSYYSMFCILILITVILHGQNTFPQKCVLLSIMLAVQIGSNVLFVQESMYCERYFIYEGGNPQFGMLGPSTLLLFVSLSLTFLAFYMEKASKVLFVWKKEVESQKETASDIRRRNEALVYNILPPHVAAHFLGNRKRQHEELYSQSYAEVGVLFASMPNFSEFYCEDDVNKQGLECLRFLNEVISDFDALLEVPKFKEVIKIKTIGSTYMAASGLDPNFVTLIKPTDPIEVRWKHLDVLIEFAIELKKALTGINENSFNHFVLKMGVNHGPITAGVIGARKPHYDIWGNTVNVASRMESTGRAGFIQVTEETMLILQHFGYMFEQRGLVSVKGKGQLMTYYLLGKNTSGTHHPYESTIMEPLKEVDEEHEKAEEINETNLTLELDETNETEELLKKEDVQNGVIVPIFLESPSIYLV
uniref:adenylate cyclase n=1 Tax=Cacopsylla melanoneura TaxID=428564 RepID=A0A8D8TR29_9HEMI